MFGMINKGVTRRMVLKAGAIGAGSVLLEQAGFAWALPSGPSTNIDAYVIPSMAGVETKAIITVNNLNADNGYRMVGIPDGLGAYKNDNNTFTLLMNHELTPTAGIARAHGSTGAFVSKWTIRKSDLRVLAGADMTASANDVYLWNKATSSYQQGTTQWNRLCSADLPVQSALRHGNRGTSDKIFFNGEETDADGRAWARIATGPHAGEAWELPRLGMLPWENVVAAPGSKDKTVIMCLDDGDLDLGPGSEGGSMPCELVIYIGTKTNSGHPVERAGLTNGKLYGVQIFRGNTLVTEESDAFGFGNAGTGYVGSARFRLVELGPSGNVSAMNAAQLQAEAVAKNAMRFRRIEDGAWNPRRDEDFYFVTTGDIGSVPIKSRLWRMRFDDLEDDPEDGGRIEIILGGAVEGPFEMFDNMCIDRHNRILLNEDPGGSARLAKVWLYDIDSKQLVEVAAHDPRFFLSGHTPAMFITQNEETSGIIDAEDILGRGWFLMDVQAHRNIVGAPFNQPELVEQGQLLAMFVDPDIGGRGRGDDDDDDDDDGDDEDDDD